MSVQETQQTEWDVVVVGAGPAGSMAARSSAKLGLRVLLIDRARFPRSKVCGCCVNRAAMGLLHPHERDLIESEAVSLQSYVLASGGQVARVPLSGGIAISRDRLDSHLIVAAIQSGAQFLDATQVLHESRESKGWLDLKRGHEQGSIRCKVAVLATGLAGKCLRDAADTVCQRSPRSHIGAGVILQERQSDFESGTVSMAVHRSGYVGIVQLEDGRLDLAAALDVGFVKRLGGLSNAARRVISESGLSVPDGIQNERWHGTVKLTHRRPQLFGTCYLVVGDAAGYVEPFTGEGIAWAMASGRAVAHFAARAMSESLSVVGPAWSDEHQRLLGSRMRVCRGISFLLRQPSLVHLAVRALQIRPHLARPVQRWLNAPYVVTAD